MEHPQQRSQVRKTQSTARRKYPYSFPKQVFRAEYSLTLRLMTPCVAIPQKASTLRLNYHLSKNKDYEDLGGNSFDEWDRQAVQKRLVRRLEKLGYEVTLEPTSPAM